MAHALPITGLHIVPVECDLTGHNLLILRTFDVVLRLRSRRSAGLTCRTDGGDELTSKRLTELSAI